MRSAFVFAFLLVTASTAFAASSSPAPQLHDQVEAWRKAHERQVLAEFSDFLALPDVATNVPDIEANAKLLVKMIEARGLKAKILSAGPGTPPAVYGELKVPGARRTWSITPITMASRSRPPSGARRRSRR